MGYLINHEIFFSDADGCLTNITTDEVIILTVTASMILTYLIDTQGKISSREDIASYIENSFEYRISKNTISQYISNIRKSLFKLGLFNNVLITVPRTGVYISNEIIIENIEMQAIDEIKKNGVLIKTTTTSKSRRKNILSLCLLMIFLTFSFYYFLQTKIHQKYFDISTSADTIKIGNIDSCPLFSFSHESNENYKKKYIEPAKKIADTFYPCKGDFIYFFQPDSLVIHGYPGHVYFARCIMSTANGINTYSECENFYLNGGGEQ